MWLNFPFQELDINGDIGIDGSGPSVAKIASLIDIYYYFIHDTP